MASRQYRSRVVCLARTPVGDWSQETGGRSRGRRDPARQAGASPAEAGDGRAAGETFAWETAAHRLRGARRVRVPGGGVRLGGFLLLGHRGQRARDAEDGGASCWRGRFRGTAAT